MLATIVGWLLVALVLWFFAGWIIGAVRAILRLVVILVVLGALAALWLRLRGD